MTNNCVFQAEEKLAPAQSRSYPPPRRGACKRSAAAHLEINAMISSSLLESMKASSPTDPSPKPTSETAVSDWNKRHPSALKVFDEIIAAAKGKKIVMFLDYDGTLSPIVDDPDSAFMSDAMRETVRCVAKHFPTAIVSGRCRDKIFGFVQLAELYYAGSHGMDIKGPTQCPNHANVQPKTVLCQPATAFISTINQVYNVLLEKTRMIPGAKVENNRFCLSVHFRCVEEKSWICLAEEVRSALASYSDLKLTLGRKVLEIRPAIEWDKGKALEFLLEELGFADRTDILPVYIGDDRTDEDAFKALRSRGQGFGILVSKFPKETFANYSLKEPSEVKDFLRRLVEWMRTSVKALHRAL